MENIPDYIELQTTWKLANRFTCRADLHCERHYWLYSSEHFCLPYLTDGFRRGKLSDWLCNNLVSWRQHIQISTNERSLWFRLYISPQ